MDVESELFKVPVETMAERIRIVYKTKELCDCSFVVGEKKEKILAHRIFLALTSPVFFSMMFGSLPETGEEINIPDVTSRGFTGMLAYIYTDAVKFDSIQHAVETLMAAKKYIIPLLERKCVDFIEANISAKNCLEFYELAKELAYKSLENRCLDFIRTKTTEVLDDSSFLEASESSVKAIIEQDTLNVACEFYLFKKIEKWLIEEGKRRAKTLEKMAKDSGEILKHVRFLAMPSVEFSCGPAESVLLSDGEKLAVLKWHTSRNIDKLPPSLCRLSHSRCDSLRTSGTLHFSVEMSFLCGMAVGNSVYSQPSTIANVPWRIKILADILNEKLTSYFSICTKDAEKNMMKHPASVRMRLLDEAGVEIEICVNKVPKFKGWQELKITCHDKEDQLCFEYPIGLYINGFKIYNIMQVEVKIEA